MRWRRCTPPFAASRPSPPHWRTTLPRRPPTPQRWSGRSCTTPGRRIGGRARCDRARAIDASIRTAPCRPVRWRTQSARAGRDDHHPARCVLLDEPTNHLDDEAMDLLEEFLSGLPGIVVAASHDRVFLDRIATEIIDLDPTAFGTDGRGGRRYGGGFTQYLGHKAATRGGGSRPTPPSRTEIAELRRRRPDRHLEHRPRPGTPGQRQVHLLVQGRQGGPRARPAGARRAAPIGHRGTHPGRRPPRPLAFAVGCPVLPPNSAGRRHRPDQGYARARPGERADARRPSGDKLLLTGANGSGKSSLLAVLAGRLRPTGGSVQVAAGRIGLLEQDVVFDDPDASALATFADAIGAGATYDDPDDAAAELLTGARPAPPARDRFPGWHAQRRATAPAGPGDPDRRSPRPGAARRTHQPHLADAGGRARGRARSRTRDGRRGES